MTNEQINIALAKWHTEGKSKLYPPDTFKMVGNKLCHHDFDNGYKHFIQPYTESLDTMRLIEELMTHEQRIGAAFQIEGFLYMATAEQRARAAVKVLGLEVGE